ncbi:MAG: hypothetical protein ACKVE3_04065 [Dissulfuribacterales bacterium]
MFADGIVCCSRWCTPGMGVNLWGESPLYMNPVPSFMMVAKVPAEGKGVTVRWWSLSADRQVKEAGVQSYEPTCLRAPHRQANRNGIQGPVSG